MPGSDRPQSLHVPKPYVWPDGFERVPREEWVDRPIDDLARSYDRVRRHGWYANLDPVVEELRAYVHPGDILMDYSGGTGILVDRLRSRIGDLAIGMLIVDASAKFLRFAVDVLRGDPRTAFRLLRYLKDAGRLQSLEEVIDPPVLWRGVDAIACTNAIHLYPELDRTLASWSALLRPARYVFINSGNILDRDAASDEWIIDTTVAVLNEVAERLVREDERYAAHRAVLTDRARMAAYGEYRDQVFLPPRALSRYLESLERTGFAVENASARRIIATVSEWHEFLKTYSDAVLGWIGGTEKVEGRVPGADALRDRDEVLRRSLGELFGGADTFPCRWTFIRAKRRAR